MTALERMADALVGANDDGANYVWFEYGVITMAERLRQADGARGFRHLYEALNRPTQEALIDTVSDVDPTTAGLVGQWPAG